MTVTRGGIRGGIDTGIIRLVVVFLFDVFDFVASVLKQISNARAQIVTHIGAAHEKRFDHAVVEFFFARLLDLRHQHCHVPIHEEAFLFFLDRLAQLLDAFAVGHGDGSLQLS